MRKEIKIDLIFKIRIGNQGRGHSRLKWVKSFLKKLKFTASLLLTMFCKRRSGIFTINFENRPHLFPMLTLNW